MCQYTFSNNVWEPDTLGPDRTPPSIRSDVAQECPVATTPNAIIAGRMTDAPPPRPPIRPISPLKLTPAAEAKTLCDRCGAEMYRMHAVWRCPGCGFKTDCCGW